MTGGGTHCDYVHSGNCTRGAIALGNFSTLRTMDPKASLGYVQAENDTTNVFKQVSPSINAEEESFINKLFQ